jgi:ribosomal protein L9
VYSVSKAHTKKMKNTLKGHKAYEYNRKTNQDTTLFGRRKRESNADKLDLLDTKLSDRQVLNSRQPFVFTEHVTVCLLFIFG